MKQALETIGLLMATTEGRALAGLVVVMALLAAIMTVMVGIVMTEGGDEFVD